MADLWKPTRWQRLCWRLEDWAPFYQDDRGERCWMTPWDYFGLLWHRLGCALGWVPSHGDPVRPRRVLVVPYDTRPREAFTGAGLEQWAADLKANDPDLYSELHGDGKA